ncbi:MAG TPA: glycosyltransferase family 39 protein [Pyrinomonadaceae bacterium]|nr:glycosyltransferase family 39 protein [Pyrinomonadaceae bacterium]
MARPLDTVSEGAERVALGARAHGLWLVEALERYAVVVLVLLAASGFALRAAGVSEVGFAEDEINKLEAVRDYARGRIAANAEHPMLMKNLIFVSTRAAAAWNAFAPEAARVTDEAALRLPNILCGALTVFPLFLLTAVFFGRRTGLVAAALWAFGINAVTYNRVAKEDTLLVFFMLWAFYFYVRAKAASGFEVKEKRRNYVLSGVAFGLMLASKYFPHYFGLNMLYHHHVKLRRREPDEPRGRTPRLFYFVTAAAFLLVNPAILLPETWRYLSAYSSESLLTHTGYLMGETLYPNVMSATPFGGTPVYFYLLFLFIKVPLPVVAALAAGLWVCARRWREPGPAFLLLMFLLWVVPYSLVGAKWLRYALSLMPFVYMIAAVGVVATVKACAGWASSTRSPRGNLAWWATGAAMLAAFVAAPAWIAFKSRPHFALYTNALAAERAGYFFPHDEFYDDGLREAVRYVAAHAPPGATVAHETPGVVRYYLEKFGRTDLRSRIISDPAFDATAEREPAFFILQRGRTYFENRDEFEALRRTAEKRHEVTVRGVSAAEVYANAPASGSARATRSGPAP